MKKRKRVNVVGSIKGKKLFRRLTFSLHKLEVWDIRIVGSYMEDYFGRERVLLLVLFNIIVQNCSHSK